MVHPPGHLSHLTCKKTWGEVLPSQNILMFPFLWVPLYKGIIITVVVLVIVVSASCPSLLSYMWETEREREMYSPTKHHLSFHFYDYHSNMKYVLRYRTALVSIYTSVTPLGSLPYCYHYRSHLNFLLFVNYFWVCFCAFFFNSKGLYALEADQTYDLVLMLITTKYESLTGFHQEQLLMDSHQQPIQLSLSVK